MNRKAVTTIVVVAVVLIGVGVALAVRSNNSDSMDGMNMSAPQKSNTRPVATNSVTISNFAFSPSNITVKKGTTVTWTNKDSTAHTVTETDGRDGPGSGDLANGKSYSFTYNTVGSFKYDCSIHPYMTGTVTVTD